MHHEKSTCSKGFAVICFLLSGLIFYPVLGKAQQDGGAVPPKESEGVAQPSMDVIEIEYKVSVPAVAGCSKDQSVPGSCQQTSDSSDLAKNFKMLAPVDWKVDVNYGMYAFFMTPKVKAVPTPDFPIAVDPNLAVAVSKNPMPIDEAGLESLAIKIEGEINKDPYGVERPNKFKIFQKILIDVGNGRQGYLYYTYGNMNNLKLRQAILVMSTDLAAYRVVLTDVEANFDKTLQKMYPIMVSINLQGMPPKAEASFTAFFPWAIVCLSGLLLYGVVKFSMIRRSRRLIAEVSMDYGEVATSEAPKSVPLSDASGVSDVSNISNVSNVSNISNISDSYDPSDD